MDGFLRMQAAICLHHVNLRRKLPQADLQNYRRSHDEAPCETPHILPTRDVPSCPNCNVNATFCGQAMARAKDLGKVD